jgi:hypothetical protein
MWQQLDLVPALSLDIRAPPQPSVIHLALSCAEVTSVEALLPTILPHAFIPQLCVDFFFSGEGRPAGGTVSSLVDQALRGLWEKDLAKVAPALGAPGLVKQWEGRMEDVDVLAEILADFPFGETSEEKTEEENKVRAQLWTCVTSHVRTEEKLKRIVWDGTSDGQEEEVEEGEESELEEEENM